MSALTQSQGKRPCPDSKQQNKRSCHATEPVFQEAEALFGHLVSMAWSIESLERLKDFSADIIDKRISDLKANRFVVSVSSSGGRSEQIKDLSPEVKIGFLIDKVASVFDKRPSDIKLCFAESVISEDPDITLASLGIQKGTHLTMVAIPQLTKTQKRKLQAMIDSLSDHDMERVFEFLGIDHNDESDDEIRLDLESFPALEQQNLQAFVSQLATGGSGSK